MLDDGPHAHAAAHIAAALPNGAPRCVRLRHVSVPPDASGRVSMRLKRNVALLLASADALCFFDDDDWRARDSVATQLAVLGDADVCTLQVQHVCELDASRRAARYFGLADGGGIFSRRLGNPGTMLLRRRIWLQRTPTSAFRRRRARTSTSCGYSPPTSPRSTAAAPAAVRTGSSTPPRCAASAVPRRVATQR